MLRLPQVRLRHTQITEFNPIKSYAKLAIIKIPGGRVRIRSNASRDRVEAKQIALLTSACHLCMLGDVRHHVIFPFVVPPLEGSFSCKLCALKDPNARVREYA